MAWIGRMGRVQELVLNVVPIERADTWFVGEVTGTKLGQEVKRFEQYHDGRREGSVTTASDLFFYGLVGASWLNTELNVKFATASSRTTTVPGFTLGGGTEYQPSRLRIFGAPVSVFLQYQDSWWSDADFNKPALPPAFNYTFERDDDTLTLGLNVYLTG